MRQFLIKKLLSATLPKSESARPTTISFANGACFELIPGKREITITFRTTLAEWRTLLFDYVGFCESYRDCEIDIDGEDALRKLIRMSYEVPKSEQFSSPIVRILKWIQEWRFNNRNYAAALANLNYHYSLPSEFFHIIAGELYGYSEGYMENGDENQNEAQFKKYDYICRKLNLQKGDKLVEVGTGWGTMALLAARRYGAEVVNYGLIDAQNKVFQARIKRLGLEDRITNVVRDARQLGQEREKYDKYVSLGVFEHAGIDCYEEWIRNIADSLKPGGVGVMAFTGHMREYLIDYFIGKYLWRGGYIPSLGEVLKVMQKYDLNLIDIENARFFYADTMKVMMRRMNDNWDRIQEIDPAIFTESFKRTWNIYYSGSIESFYAAHNNLHAFQLVFVKGRDDVYPRTRKFLYEKPFDLSDMRDYEEPFESGRLRTTVTGEYPERNPETRSTYRSPASRVRAAGDSGQNKHP